MDYFSGNEIRNVVIFKIYASNLYKELKKFQIGNNLLILINTLCHSSDDAVLIDSETQVESPKTVHPHCCSKFG